MPKKATHKKKASPKSRPTYKSRGGTRDSAAGTTFNPPSAREGQVPGPQGEQVDEDRTGRSIGRFGGAGQPTLPRK